MSHPAPARVLFLLQRPEAWNNVSRVWELMRDNPAFSPTILALPYNYSSPDARQRSTAPVRELLEALAVPFIEWSPDSTVLRPGEFDVALLTAPYDRERPGALHFEHIAAAVKATIYIPYGLAMGSGIKNTWYQFKQPTQCRASAVVARSAGEKSLYGKYCPAGSSHVRAIGLPRLDLMQDLAEFPPDRALVSAVGDRVAVLWNSHFSFSPRHAQGTEYSTFDRIGARLLRFACDNPRLALIWRPHPGLFHELVASGTCSAGDIAALRAELLSAGVIIDERPDHRHAFALSRALMSDLGSFLIEYLVTGRPILYLRNPDGELPNEEAETLLKSFYVAEDNSDVNTFLAMILRGDDPLAEERRRVRSVALPFLDGRASQRVCDLALELLASEQSCEAKDYPALARLEASLDAINAEKRARSPLGRRLLRAYKGIRAQAVEIAKRYPWLLRLLDRPH